MSTLDPEITRPGGMPREAQAVASVGPYRIVREIGRGGMGTVFEAVRSGEGFEKRVALKILKRGSDSDAIVRRFRAERQILARLEHPYISTLIDGGTTADGLPYFAMELVDGRPIDEYCSAEGIGTNGRLQLFLKICSAVQHAHQNLVIHCDIKPANVLVTAEGTPKLLDFGIAKLLQADGGATLALTIDGAPLLTPEYASPEQVRGGVVTTATDVYSLGVLLYELLTGRRPYRLTSRLPAEIVRVICDSVPERPSTAVTRTPGSADEAGSDPAARTPAEPERLRRRLVGDLDTIVLKALSKDPARRYPSVEQFAEDVRRHLAGLPVLARPDTLGYRVGKFVSRNRAGVAAATVGAIALVAGTVAATWQARIAQRERAVAERRFEDVRQLANVALIDIHDAIRDLPGATPARQLLVTNGLAYLDRLSRDAGDRDDLRRELAAAYVKIGDVQGRPFNPNLGDTAGALDSYRKAVATYEAINAQASDDPGLRREVARAYQRLSEVLSSTGGTEEALAHARRSLELLQQPTDREGGGEGSAAELGRELAASYTRVGDLLSATGDTAGALEHRRRAVAVMRTVFGLAPEDPATIRLLATAHTKLGNQLGNPNFPNVNDPAAALPELERAAEVLVEGVRLHPSNAMLRRNLAITHSNTADVLTALNRRDEALARQREAQAAFEALTAADPANASARNDLAISVSKIAEMLDNAGRSADAVREYQRALEIHQALVAADPGNDGYKLELAADFNRLATAQAKTGDRPGSLANHGQAIATARQLQQANPANVELKVAVGLALGGRADALVSFAADPRHRATRDADLAAAERDYAESVAIFTTLEQDGAIGGSDLDTLKNNRAALAKVRAQRAPAR